MIDVQEKKTYHIDPTYIEATEISKNSKMCFRDFNKYLAGSLKVKPNTLNTTKWTNDRYLVKRPLQPETDKYNCGIYIMYYMDCIAQNMEYDMEFIPNKYRSYVAELLLRESECMEQICLLCFEDVIDDFKLTCHICNRFVHINCLFASKKDPEIQFDSYICFWCSQTLHT